MEGDQTYALGDPIPYFLYRTNAPHLRPHERQGV